VYFATRTVLTITAYTSVTMPINVTTSEKKAEIARDVVVAYLSHVKDEQLADLGKVDEAITRLIDVVDRQFQVEQHRAPGFGMPPSIPAPASHHD
jgi:hypothetical protein